MKKKLTLFFGTEFFVQNAGRKGILYQFLCWPT